MMDADRYWASASVSGAARLLVLRNAKALDIIVERLPGGCLLYRLQSLPNRARTAHAHHAPGRARACESLVDVDEA